MKSFYLLELSVSPGAARKADSFIYNNLHEIKIALETDIKIDLMAGVGLLYCYKEDISLRTFINGVERQNLNLLPYITIHGADGTKFPLDEKANPIGVFETIVCQEDFFMGASAQRDWSSIHIMELTGDLLQKGEAVDLVMLYGGDYPDVYQYGFNDLECGMTEEEYLQEITGFLPANT